MGDALKSIFVADKPCETKVIELTNKFVYKQHHTSQKSIAATSY